MEDVGEPLVDVNFGHGRYGPDLYVYTAIMYETNYDIISWK